MPKTPSALLPPEHTIPPRLEVFGLPDCWRHLESSPTFTSIYTVAVLICSDKRILNTTLNYSYQDPSCGDLNKNDPIGM